MLIAHPCPCCGYLTSSGPGSYDICKICGWEDDVSQLRFPETGGANRQSLVEAQKVFATMESRGNGVVDGVRIRRVGPDDVRDPTWRPIDLTTDNIERPIPGFEYGATYPEDLTRLYYWRPDYWRRTPRDGA